MGCASSKPSKDKKSSSKQQKLNKKSKSTDNGIQQHSANDEASLSTKQDANIRIEKTLIDQIKKNELKVIEYIVAIVRRETNVDNNNEQQNNNDLIDDVVSKAVNTLVNTPVPNKSLTYKSLNSSLKSWPFICKNQANKTRICDITTDTIRDCLNTINQELDDNSKFDLVHFLAQNNMTTPPQTPEKSGSVEESWNDDAVLMNRTKANQLARLLFLSNKARPVIHPSTRVKDAYFVNRELADKTQVCISQNEIDDLLNNSTYKNNPHISPVAQRKLDFNHKDLMPRSETSPENIMLNETTVTNITVNGDDSPDSTLLLEKVENQNQRTGGGAFIGLDSTVEEITWMNLTTAEDFEKKQVVNLTNENDTSCDTSNLLDQFDSINKYDEDKSVETSCDTNVIDQSDQTLSHKESDYLKDIVNEINSLHVVEGFSAVTPPPTPTPTVRESCSESVENNGIEEEVESLKAVAAILSLSVDTEKNNSIVEAEGKLDPVLKQDLLDDRFYNNEYKDGPPVNGNEADNEAATKIQASFKGEAVRQADQQGEPQN